MGRRARSRSGFTLVELMVTVGIMGLLSATAIPTFTRMVARSKTAEVSGNLSSLFKLSASYYASERSDQGNGAGVTGRCTVDDAGPSPALPGPSKQVFVSDPSFTALAFSIADYTYFSYGVASRGGVSSCGITPGTAEVYTFYAHGDLDGDSIESTFELAAGSDNKNVLYHQRAFFTHQESE